MDRLQLALLIYTATISTVCLIGIAILTNRR